MLISSDEAISQDDERFKLLSLKASFETGELPKATVFLSEGIEEKRAEASGSGQVDATFKAIESIVSSGADLQLYSVNAVTSGTDSQGEVTVRLSRGGRIVNGQGSDTDIVIASAKAYISALNKLHAKYERTHAQL